jgi:hypothetical protein
MALDIRSVDGTVQLVVSVEVLETILSRFPGLTVFSIPTTEDDIPTYGFAPKEPGTGKN